MLCCLKFACLHKAFFIPMLARSLFCHSYCHFCLGIFLKLLFSRYEFQALQHVSHKRRFKAMTLDRELCWVLLVEPQPASLNSIFFVKAATTTNPFPIFNMWFCWGKPFQCSLLSAVLVDSKNTLKDVACVQRERRYFSLTK